MAAVGVFAKREAHISDVADGDRDGIGHLPVWFAATAAVHVRRHTRVDN